MKTILRKQSSSPIILLLRGGLWLFCGNCARTNCKIGKTAAKMGLVTPLLTLSLLQNCPTTNAAKARALNNCHQPRLNQPRPPQSWLKIKHVSETTAAHSCSCRGVPVVPRYCGATTLAPVPSLCLRYDNNKNTNTKIRKYQYVNTHYALLLLQCLWVRWDNTNTLLCKYTNTQIRATQCLRWDNTYT